MPNNTPTAFTDGELKTLKDSISHDREMGHVLGTTLSLDGKEALVSRLEAAERCAGYLGSLAVLDTTMEVLLKEWQEASGKK